MANIRFSLKEKLPIGFYEFTPCNYVCDICRQFSKVPTRGIGLGIMAIQWDKK